MDDDFLNLYRRMPPKEFETELHARLNGDGGIPSLWRNFKSGMPRTTRIAIITVALIGLAGACARAVLTPRWVQIGEYQVYETSGECNARARYPYAPSQPDATNPPPDPANLLSLDEVKSRLAYDLKVPTWAPVGFQPRFSVTDVVPNMSLHHYWYSDASVYSIYMHVTPVRDPSQELSSQAARGTAEAVSINGDPGLLVRGSCGYIVSNSSQDIGELELAWDENVNTLVWQSNGVDYFLHSQSPEVSAEDLVRMAESAR